MSNVRNADKKQKPPLLEQPAAISFPSIVIPACSILVAIFSLALPVFFGQYVLGLVLACLGLVGAIVGLILLLIMRWKGIPNQLAALAIGVAGVLLAVNALVLRTSIERNEDLGAKNEHAALKAKADLDDAARKLADAEEVFQKAADAPKKADAFYAMAKNVQAKTDAAEKRTTELLAKVENLERKNDLDRKKTADDKAKVELAEKNVRAQQKNLDQEHKEIEEKRQELVTLKKEIEGGKKKAEEDLEALKKEIDANKKKADEKNTETKNLMKKIADALKGATLELKRKNPDVRVKTAKAMAKLPTFPEAKEMVGESLVQAMMDPLPAVRDAPGDALEKIDPAVYPHVFTLLNGQNKMGAVRELERLGKNAKAALPALIILFQTGQGGQLFRTSGERPSRILDSLALVAPDDSRVAQIINKRDRQNTPHEKPFF